MDAYEKKNRELLAGLIEPCGDCDSCSFHCGAAGSVCDPEDILINISVREIDNYLIYIANNLLNKKEEV